MPEANCGCLFEGNYYTVSENPALVCAPARALPYLYLPAPYAEVWCFPACRKANTP